MPNNSTLGKATSDSEVAPDSPTPNISTRDLQTKCLVLKRTNYGETDRILNVLTPEGKLSVLAKGARKEKSKLAGGIEMFSLSEIVVHYGKSDLAVLTSARSKEFYKGILADFNRLEVASEIIKKISKVSEQVSDAGFFSVTVQALRALDRGKSTDLVLAWFYFNVAKLSGEQINLYTDTDGNSLIIGESYTWDSTEKALHINKSGPISTNEIKMMRLLLSAELNLCLRVSSAEQMARELLYIAKSVNQV